jgi:hypothetical protein
MLEQPFCVVGCFSRSPDVTFYVLTHALSTGMENKLQRLSDSPLTPWCGAQHTGLASGVQRLYALPVAIVTETRH